MPCSTSRSLLASTLDIPAALCKNIREVTQLSLPSGVSGELVLQTDVLAFQVSEHF